MPGPILVTVVTGFLGAGKSTLVERWLSELPRDETAVIVNERGEVGVDGELLASRVSRLREITGGCVCCSTQAELGAALAELAQTHPPPTRILVETSGAASPAGVVRALTRGRARERLRLDGIVTVVDATRVEQVLVFDVAIEQLGFADVIVISHADRRAEIDLETLARDLVRHAPAAVLTTSRRGWVGDSEETSTPLADLLEERDRTLRILPADDAGADHQTAIDAVSLCLEGDLDEAAFGDWVESALGALEARILRVKGILAMEGIDERVIVQGVGEAVEVTLGAPWGEADRSSRLVVLGLGLDALALETGFAAAAAERAPTN